VSRFGRGIGEGGQPGRDGLGLIARAAVVGVAQE
jgi:hypothetical protein